MVSSVVHCLDLAPFHVEGEEVTIGSNVERTDAVEKILGTRACNVVDIKDYLDSMYDLQSAAGEVNADLAICAVNRVFQCFGEYLECLLMVRIDAAYAMISDGLLKACKDQGVLPDELPQPLCVMDIITSYLVTKAPRIKTEIDLVSGKTLTMFVDKHKDDANIASFWCSGHAHIMTDDGIIPLPQLPDGVTSITKDWREMVRKTKRLPEENIPVIAPHPFSVDGEGSIPSDMTGIQWSTVVLRLSHKSLSGEKYSVFKTKGKMLSFQGGNRGTLSTVGKILLLRAFGTLVPFAVDNFTEHMMDMHTSIHANAGPATEHYESFDHTDDDRVIKVIQEGDRTGVLMKTSQSQVDKFIKILRTQRIKEINDQLPQ
jgi:hypothetical protein